MSKLNKKYYWLKLQATFFDDLRIKKLRNISGGDTFTCIYLKLMLLSLKNDGYIEFEGVFDTVEDEISEKLGEKIENVKATLIFCENMKMLEISDQNDLHLHQVENMTGSETASTLRSRKSRATKTQVLQCNITATPLQQNASQSKIVELEKELEKDSSSQNIQTTTTIPQEFINHFKSKNFTNVNINDEFEKFTLYNTNIKNQNILNWRRWVDKIKVTSKVETEKRDYNWQFKKLKNGSDAITDWYFTQTQQQLPTYLDFDFVKFAKMGISSVRLEHPTMPKQVSIYYRLNEESKQLLKDLGSKDEN
jgi:predicted phage replisome organizer